MPAGSEAPAGFLRRLVCRLHFVLAAAVGGVTFVTLSCLALFRLLVLKEARDPVARFWVDRWRQIMSAVLGWRVQIESRERLLIRPAVVIGNHQSNLDAVIWAHFFTDATVVVGKRQIERIPVFGPLFRATGNILIDRENPVRAKVSIQEAAERIRRESLIVWIFPEGHRNQRAEMLPFKKGAFHLAIAAQVPIVPFVDGPIWTLLDAKRWMVRPGLLRVKVLDPVPTEGLGEGDVEALLGRVRSAMETARRDLAASAGSRIG